VVVTGDNQSSVKRRASKLKEIALSKSNTGSERLRAIDLLGQLNSNAYDELADIASGGLNRIERINALEMLGKVAKRAYSEQSNMNLKQTETYRKTEKASKAVKTKHVKAAKDVKAKYKVTSNDGLPEDVFNEMLYHVRPLLTPSAGCSESEIKKQFRQLKGTVVEAFLTEAIKKGLIKEATPGTFKLIAEG